MEPWFHNARGAVRTDNARPIQVAACIVRDGGGRVLMAQRRPDQLSGGFWEIPGGKIEAGETAQAAAIRELVEETGLVATGLRHLTTYFHRFPTRRIQLTLFIADDWSGTPTGREGQRLEWVDPGHPDVRPVLESNWKALRLLDLPRVILCVGSPVGDAGSWVQECVSDAARIGAGAVLFDAPDLPQGQKIALGRRLQAGLSRVGLSLWAAAGAGGASRSGAVVDVFDADRAAGDVRPSTSDHIGAALWRSACPRNAFPGADIFIAPAGCDQGSGEAFQQLSGSAAPVFALVPESEAAVNRAIETGAFGVCVDTGSWSRNRAI
ncbi:MAG: (deoxy)nucleoside triphosphate pyrophosphohydrolase [Marinibacterium sp.]